MDQTAQCSEIINSLDNFQKGPRYERNRKYYLKNTDANLKSTLLHNVKSRGRIPAVETIQRHKISTEELVKNWTIYKNNVGEDMDRLKRLKFQVLIANLV